MITQRLRMLLKQQLLNRSPVPGAASLVPQRAQARGRH